MSHTQSERIRTASKARREQQKAEVRQSILNTASNLLCEKGYDGFSLRKLAERIGYTATTIYLYFHDKDDLLATLINERFNHWEEQVALAAAQVEDPVERLRAFARAYLEFGQNDPSFFKGAFLQRPEIIMKVMGPERLTKGLTVVREALQNGIEQGLFHPCDLEETSRALWAAVHGALTLMVTMPRFSQGQELGLVDRVIELNIAGLQRGITK
jgi:AcrR family transcriptional regulator